MRMRNRTGLTKGLSLALAGVMSVSLLAGCGTSGTAPETQTPTATAGGETAAAGSQSDPEAAGGVTYPIPDAGSFTYGMRLASAWKDRHDSYDQLHLAQELEKNTGYDLQMVHVEDSQAMNLLLASGDLPDVIDYNFKMYYPGAEAKGIKDGLIFPMSEEFVKENAPDYWKVISSNPDVLKQVKTPEGDIYGFCFILGDEILKTGQGLIIRDDWCEELGLELPETAEEYYQMLKAFKEEKGVSIPLCVGIDDIKAMLNNGYVTSPFGLVTMDTYLDNKEVKIGYAQPEFKDTLQWLNKLYEEKLLDPNFATIDKETIAANMLTGEAGASQGAAGSILGTWLTTNSGAENYSLAGIRGLVAAKGSKPMFGHYNTDVIGGVTVITSMAKDPAAVAKYFNYGYTEEGHNLYNFGTEGVSYEMKDGEPVFTDLIFNNPDGLTVKQALSEYQLAHENGPFVQDRNYLMQYYSLDEQKNALERWSDNDARNYKLPGVTINFEDTGEYSSLKSELETYRDEMIIKFIRGEESLDNYDKYLSTLESMGIGRVQEIVQNAVDEYYAR